MHQQIICVKLNQKKLPQVDVLQPFHYFPFDRAYLVPPDSTHLIPRLFRVYMLMNLTAPLLKALNLITFETINQDTIRRNWTKPTPGKGKNNFKGIIDDPTGWKLIVPTYLFNVYVSSQKTYTHAAISYVSSSAITEDHNLQATLPPISFHTPFRDFPLLCLACINLPSQMAGECSPGLAVCREKKEFKLQIDPLACEQMPSNMRNWKRRKKV